MTAPITTPAALTQAAKANKGVFDATVARAPVAVRFKGKTYPRAAAQTVEQKLWYLGAAAMTNPQSVASLANVSFSLDEVYGLDPDRSRVDAAQAALTAAKAKQSAAQGRLNSLRATLRTYEANLARAIAAQKEAQKVQVGDIFTGGISAAARNLYADGQVKIWRDRIESLQTGSLVGMAGQEGFQIPLNDGIAQNEGKLAEARQEVSAATAELNDAQRAYDAEAAANRRAEEAQRAQAARDEAARRAAEQEAAQRDAQAQRDAEAAEAARQAALTNGGDYGAGPATDPTAFVTDDGEYDTTWDPSAEQEWLDATLAADVAGDEDFVGEAFGAEEPDDVRAYVSPYDFDRYYGCDSCRAGETSDECEGGCAAAAMTRADAMEAKGLDGEGYGFDPTIIVVILSAILALAPTIIGMFAPPPAAEDGQASATTDPLSTLLAGGAFQTPEQRAQLQAEAERQRNMELAGWGIAALVAVKLIA